MDAILVIPLGAPLREGAHEETICKTCKHIAADWDFCKPLIVTQKTTDDNWRVVTECCGYRNQGT